MTVNYNNTKLSDVEEKSKNLIMYKGIAFNSKTLEKHSIKILIAILNYKLI